jgi:hypothetical protein
LTGSSVIWRGVMVAPVAAVAASTSGELTWTAAATPSIWSATSKTTRRLSVTSRLAVRVAKPFAETATV